MIKDYYKTLNINRDSSQDDIKKAFRSLSKQHHPDKGGDETVFKELSEAYDTLSNPEKKQRYDVGGQNPFGGHNPFANRGPDMDDLFGEFFGRQNRRQNVKKGKNLNIPLKVDLEEIFFNKTKKLKYKKQIKCASCGGPGGEAIRCATCNGAGHIEKVAGNAFFRQVQRHVCGGCAGSGKIIIKPCNYCKGSGAKSEDRVIDFKVPIDLSTGQTFIYKDGGNEIHAGQTGDLLIEVVIVRHKHFKLFGSDLIYEPEIPVIDMVLGCDIEVPHFENTLKVTIPALSNVTQTFNLSGKGMKNLRGLSGNLVIKPKVIMPKKIEEDEIRMLESLSEGKNFKL